MNNQIISILNGIRPEFDFSEDVNFIEEGILDSFDVVSLVSELEENFGININGVDILPENFSSIENIKSLINKSEKK
ncbi:MAG: acyl carrier protein [Bacteroidales bacterium 52_46]|nr:MAG: acyl carrier protein [Bacteroidales bacterium 52_46]